ncbi:MULTISPECIES: GTP-binding protein [Prochlorococcus]|uniref:Membrane associated GTPase n=1 Tax=Prochlorococcus marinus (strain SARG / CCMP1375 / SS120) TaxID=167539 RepID=Q7VA70_PROMA|nr:MULTISPECIES: GTP-binding protein [Prochlorococcus]AAQ00641.1 Membrane associated GTPase [Prochlorococcus marinus subsp. marinus str. CCMP1375]KGG10864.1 hypothetical protein EV04_1826 [Prochlorococcus marinus str. LG]KGG20444.1 hypothetical protein EV08_1028 [Prochlorococcus marinus str. SS2]KGG24113.1 hypothetical protein EV09_0718 [Prochlorococcus marinus str. SS35]KGG31630.1 hypothetical protein EV10_1725 [Prochlorococcus marinus str. SS51]
MTILQSPSAKCSSLLKEWKEVLNLTHLEQVQFSGEILALDRQINRLAHRHIRLTVFGRVGVGKSSLLNALFGRHIFATDVANGFTRKSKGAFWEQSIQSLETIELVDTPGIDEIAASARARLARRVALYSDLVLLVLDSDITSVELEALQSLIETGKPVLLVLNRCDQWEEDEVLTIVESIRNRLPASAKHLLIETVAAAPRKAKVFSDGRVRSEECAPKVQSLKKILLSLLEDQGNILLTLNALQQAESFYQSLKKGRLKRRRLEAQGLIGKFATLKASGVAVNPLIMFDFATGLAFDTALIVQLSKLYGLELKGRSARNLLKKLSLHNGLLGGAQLAIQLALGTVQHLLLLATPFTGGLSLAPAGPVAIAQAIIAIHTTKLTGRLAAKEILRNSHLPGANPRSILRQLSKSNPNVQKCLQEWNINPYEKPKSIQALLP